MLLGTQRVNRDGHLEIGGCDTVDLALEFGTPLYVMDEEAIRTNCREYKRAFDAHYPHNEICYAGKAFLTTAMACLVAHEGLCLDVASAGELYTALASGFPRERINLHGNNKSREEIEMAISNRIGHIILDNFLEINLVQKAAHELNRTVNVLVRSTPGVDPATHRLIRTGQADTKFGFNIADGSAIEAVKRVERAHNLKFMGLHCHVGSQLLDAETHQQAVEIMVRLMSAVHTDTKLQVAELNIGGGLGVRYLSSHRPPDYAHFAEQVTAPLKAELDRAGLAYPKLIQEPGRSIVGEAGTTLYAVGAIKTVPITETLGTRTYVSIDGGMSDNPRPQLYEAVYECIVANKADRPADSLVTIAGKHCETDILIWDAQVANVETGDLLAVQTTGAYNYAMASNYNRFRRPAVVFVADGSAELVVKRETLADVVSRDIIPERLQLPLAGLVRAD